MYLGSLFGAWIGGSVAARLGRRVSLQLLNLPYLIGWIITGFAANSFMLLIGRYSGLILFNINKLLFYYSYYFLLFHLRMCMLIYLTSL